jgi:hypothetical protein
MKAGKLFSAIIMGGILLTAGSSMAGEDSGAESIVLKGGRQGSVTFPHGRHQAQFVDCMPCHELFPKKSPIIDQMKTEGTLQKKVVMNMCKKCHKSLVKEGRKAGPTTCRGCHKK